MGYRDREIRIVHRVDAGYYALYLEGQYSGNYGSAKEAVEAAELYLADKTGICFINLSEDRSGEEKS